MEKNNLNTAPTEQELINAGFCKAGASNHSNYGKLIKRINDNLFVMFGGKKCSLCFDYGHVDTTIKEIEPTKAAINAEFEHFGQPLPQWEKPKPKVGEVWGNLANVLIITPRDDKAIGAFYISSKYDNIYSFTIFPDFQNLKDYGYKKLADTLDDYYKEKFLQNCTDWANKNEESDDGLKQQESQEEECYLVHQYSYKGLKAEGKIPHDRSGEDHDSIEAFKKLLAICEALNGMFRDSGMYLYNPYWDKQKQELFYITNEYQDESPICFTSKEAFDAFKSAPENVELFKTFLKLK